MSNECGRRKPRQNLTRCEVESGSHSQCFLSVKCETSDPERLNDLCSYLQSLWKISFDLNLWKSLISLCFFWTAGYGVKVRSRTYFSKKHWQMGFMPPHRQNLCCWTKNGPWSVMFLFLSSWTFRIDFWTGLNRHSIFYNLSPIESYSVVKTGNTKLKRNFKLIEFSFF